MSDRCPGQDTRFWRPEDIFDVACPCCGAEVEFFKDDIERICACGCHLTNPKLDPGCARHCNCAATRLKRPIK
ncbi:hypothetical protein ACFL6C_05170 [Myxococcota bacterium]